MLDEFSPALLLTRREAAQYKGLSGESSVRDAQERGLITGRVDPEGRTLYAKEDLDDWSVRSREPSEAKKRSVLNSVAKTREREAREHERTEAIEAQREFEEWDAQRAAIEAQFEAERGLRANVQRKNDERRAAFELAHMNVDQAGKALGFESYESRSRLRELANRGLLRQAEGPVELRVEVTLDGAREVETTWPLCRRGPFFVREDVLTVRAEMTAAVTKLLPGAPPEVHGVSVTHIVAEFLRRMILDTK